MIKQIIIPIAAFAVTATAASAFNPDILSKLGIDLSNEQVSAITEAHELHRSGDHDAARSVLKEAGVTEDILSELKARGHKMHEQTKAAIEAGDYEAFKTLVTDGPLAEVITSEAAFDKLVEAHKLMESGDRDAAKVILDELGLERGEGIGGMMGGGHGHGPRGEQHEAVEATLEANDYEAFKTAVADTPLAEVITSAEEFAQFVKAHDLKESGDHDGAREIMKKLGFPTRGEGKGMRMMWAQ